MTQPEDDVHRMTVRAGSEQPPPENPDEAGYRQDTGDHAELARRALHAGDLKRSIYHPGLALASGPAREEWLALLDEWIAQAGTPALDYVPLQDEYLLCYTPGSRTPDAPGQAHQHGV